ncbi:hypothetical protein M422DRAFT_66939 [Sphaerobolus stellatus SS14]|uniref:Unplaced genomic scaffold SPHSTscaffold_35, whole genome shotgun sequence n=1 Tax=Sphaerobolus stellatus (strain SS14) TaxID=990650 RepID=A0A0C9W2T2_SPHS4|nr:hypothetical protein M422DRAFT_66939 [Sphaerobolus stellatus SS14]
MIHALSLTIIVVSAFIPGITGRKWNNTGKGSIIFEEAWTVPELLWQSSDVSPPANQTTEDLLANLLDIHNQRLASMDATGVDFMVLSCATPCVQGFSDPATAEEIATSVNNQLAAAISNNTMRFGAFAALSMHNASQAAQELKRAVNELGFLGALINDYQQSGADNTTLLYYDQPEYDVFWAMVEELDVPVYMHPRANIAQLQALEYQHAIWIASSVQGFAATLSTHILGLCANGIFDRFPKLKIIIGHSGERIPSDLVRIDEQLRRQFAKGLPMNGTVTSYWETNLFETTSGNFATNLLFFHIGEIGLNRITYSVDYPYVSMEEGANWVKTLPLKENDLMHFQRESAIKLLGLDK